ncbi:MAG: hypothetical protein KBD53_06980 [Candidatus Omnitrophica bacterium]|nr:hypothetical protein [Candidatus Omnitrophota bacterium]
MLAKKIAVGFGIAIILPMLVHYGVKTFSPEPKWGDQYESYYYQDYQNASVEEKKKLTEERRKKDQEFSFKRKKFEEKLFCVALPVGIIAIVVGSVISVQAIGAGLIFGGIFSLVNGYCWYWSELQDWMRFLSLLIAFVVILFCSYMKLNDRSKIEGGFK